MFCRILVIVDGSPGSERALTEAIDIASASRARLTILTPVPKPPGWVCTPMAACASAQLAVDFERDSKAILERAVDAVPADVPVTKIMTYEPLCKALRHQVQTGNHDLLVVGGAGRGALASSLLGTVSRRLLDRCGIPVLLVRDDGQPVTAPPEPRAASSTPAGHSQIAVSPS